jgi:hypothetical protein
MIKKFLGFLMYFVFSYIFLPAVSYAKGITVIGDSVTLGASKYIKYYIPDAVVDAKVGRKFQEVMGRILDLERKGLLKDTVIIALGTNGPFTVEEGLRVVDYLQSMGRQVVFVNVRVPRWWESYVNATYLELKRVRPSVRIIDWNHVSRSACMNVQCFSKDGYHLTSAGIDLFVRLIYWYGYRDMDN